MKIKSLLAVLCMTFVLAANNTTQAQAWEKSSKVLSLGIGGSAFFHIYNTDNVGYNGYNLPITGQLNFQGEFGIHDYVGIGFTTGFGGRAGYGWGPRYGYWGNAYGYDASVNFPIGVIANFHFYQLIADKTGKNIHSDKLDVYGGVNVGGGVAGLFYRGGNGSTAIPIAFGGVQAGARYYFTDKFGVNLEVGFGKSIVNGGVVFKL